MKPRKILWIVFAAEGRQAIVFTSKKEAVLYISQGNAAPYGPEFHGPFRYELAHEDQTRTRERSREMA